MASGGDHSQWGDDGVLTSPGGTLRMGLKRDVMAGTPATVRPRFGQLQRTVHTKILSPDNHPPLPGTGPGSRDGDDLWIPPRHLWRESGSLLGARVHRYLPTYCTYELYREFTVQVNAYSTPNP